MRLERLRRALRAVRDYIRYDLREIVAPSSLPDPPGVKYKRLTLVQYWQVRLSIAATALFAAEEFACMQLYHCASNRPLTQAAKQATQEYRRTWKQDKKTEPEEARTGESGQPPSTDTPVSEDLGANA